MNPIFQVETWKEIHLGHHQRMRGISPMIWQDLMLQRVAQSYEVRGGEQHCEAFCDCKNSVHFIEQTTLIASNTSLPAFDKCYFGVGPSPKGLTLQYDIRSSWYLSPGPTHSLTSLPYVFVPTMLRFSWTRCLYLHLVFFQNVNTQIYTDICTMLYFVWSFLFAEENSMLTMQGLEAVNCSVLFETNRQPCYIELQNRITRIYSSGKQPNGESGSLSFSRLK